MPFLHSARQTGTIAPVKRNPDKPCNKRKETQRTDVEKSVGRVFFLPVLYDTIIPLQTGSNKLIRYQLSDSFSLLTLYSRYAVV